MNNGLPNCVSAYNAAADYASGDIFVQISDDLYPCLDWDALIDRELNCYRKEVLLVADDHLGRHAVTRHAICTFPYYEKMGYLLHPSYESMYSDDDFCASAQIHADKIVDARKRIKFEHKREYTNDEVARLHESRGRYDSGLSTFLRRKALGFPK